MDDLLDEEMLPVDVLAMRNFRTFVGKNDDFYSAKKYEMNSGKFISFNIGAAFFGLFWLLYRKMYIELVLLMAFMLLETIVVGYYVEVQNVGHEVLGYYDLGGRIFYAVLLGFGANYLYIKYCARMIEKISMASTDEEMLNSDLRKRGGTSIVGVLIGVVFLVGIVVGADFLMYKM